MDNEEKEQHPYDYFAMCPECGLEAEQAYWEVNLLKGFGMSTGPGTKAGKDKVAKNLEGHSTDVTRFNAFKTGAFAKTMTYYPARPGKYQHCLGCEYLDNGCEEQTACLKRTELLLKHQIAFESNNPDLLKENRAALQGALTAILDDIIYAIASTGVEVRTPVISVNNKTGEAQVTYYKDQNGKEKMVEVISANPLLSTMIRLVKDNNLTLGDMGMTQKKQEEIKLSGQLQPADQSQLNSQNVVDFMQQQKMQSDMLLELINGNKAGNADIIDVVAE